MLYSTYKDYDALPLFLNAKMVANILGISESTAYALMKKKTNNFPSLNIGSRIVVPRDKFMKWVDDNTD